MSTKIYNAYKFPKKLNLNELTETVLKNKTEITKKAQALYFINFLNIFIKLYDENFVHDDKWIDKENEKLESKIVANNTEIKTRITKDLIVARKEIKENNLKSAVMNIDWMLNSLVEANNIYPNMPFCYPYNFNAKLLVIPYKSKILAMVFGNNILCQVLINNLELLDYHYQNQTDKPDDISNKAWETRRKVWDSAIGPDYIPINHGFEFDLVDKLNLNLIEIKLSKNEDILTKDFIDKNILDINKRVKNLISSFDDYPNPPDANAGYAKWIKYRQTAEYKDWEENKIKVLKKELEKSNINQILYDIFDIE